MFVCLFRMAGQTAGPIETKLDTRTHVHPGSASGKVNVKVIHVCVQDWQKYETPGKRHLANDGHTTSGQRRTRHLANDYETSSNYSSSKEARRRRRRAASEQNRTAASAAGGSRTPSGGRILTASTIIMSALFPIGSEDTTFENTENRRFRLPHCGLTPLSRETLWIFA